MKESELSPLCVKTRKNVVNLLCKFKKKSIFPKRKQVYAKACMSDQVCPLKVITYIGVGSMKAGYLKLRLVHTYKTLLNSQIP